MRLSGRRSSNVEDRRGMGPVAVGGGLGAVVLALVAMLFGVDPGSIGAGPGAPGPQPQGGPAQGPPPPGQDPAFDFVSGVLAETETTWSDIFRQQLGQEYQEPRLVVFEGAVQSACGVAGSAVGPFYCPPDQQLYLDLSFFRDLQERFGAPGDFAQAYVVAHEVGHHVQNLIGVAQQVDQAGRGMSREERNQLSVMQELQADCFAGLWARQAQAAGNIALEPGEVEEALNAAAAIGDDRLQQQAQGHVVPESFTHGSSAQRVRWFQRGFESGQMSECDTFNSTRL